jgi:hypothetical protein
MFRSTVACTVVCALGSYLVFEASLPPCGPPRDTVLGRVYWFVPAALLIAQSGVVALMGHKTRRSSASVVTALVLALVMTLVGDLVVWFAFFAAGNCGE